MNDLEDDDDREDEAPVESEQSDQKRVETDASIIYSQLMHRAQHVMRITLGALLDYFRGPAFDGMTEAQKDEAFRVVVTTWASMLPAPAGDMWDDLIILTAYDSHSEKIMAEKQMEDIQESLGWGASPSEEELPPPSRN